MQKYLFTRFLLLLLVILTVKCINSRRTAEASYSNGEKYTLFTSISSTDTPPESLDTLSSLSQRSDIPALASTNGPGLRTTPDSNDQMSTSQTTIARDLHSDNAILKDTELKTIADNRKGSMNGNRNCDRPKSTVSDKDARSSKSLIGSFTRYYQFTSHYLPHPGMKKDNHRRHI